MSESNHRPNCGNCGQRLTADRGYTGEAAYHRRCARLVYGDDFREVALAEDVKHALDWIAGGIIALTLYFALEVVADFRAHHWSALGVHSVFTAWAAWSFFDTTRRARKYRDRA